MNGSRASAKSVFLNAVDIHTATEQCGEDERQADPSQAQAKPDAQSN